MIGTPSVSAIPATETLAGATGLKQTANVGKKKPLKGIKALAISIKTKKLPLHKLPKIGGIKK
jgi:hypothetical protein